MKPKTVGRDNGQVTVTSPTESAGLMSDSVILTSNGEMRVADLCPGQRVITRNSGTARVQAVRHRRIMGRAIRIKAGSLGVSHDLRDVTLAAGQGVLVRDWRAQALFGVDRVIAPASQLIDGEFVTDLGQCLMTLVDIEFDCPHILYVDGLEVAGHVAATPAIAA